MRSPDKIYVAGHSGLVGSATIRMLRAKGYTNIVTRTGKELDLRRQGDVEEFFENEKPEYVFLAAARVGGILANDTYKGEFIYDNILIAANIIHSAYKYGIKKLLNLGSSCIYPKFAPQPMKEEYLLTGSLEQTNEPYAIAKISAIKLCRYYNEQYRTNFISGMPTNLYGPGDNFNLEISHVLPAMIRKFHLAKLLHSGDFNGIRRDIQRFSLGFGLDEGIVKDQDSLRQALGKLGITRDMVILWGSGEPCREFLYVDDLADACVFLMERHDYRDIGEFINIGAGKDIKIKDLAEIIKGAVGFEGKISWDTAKPDGMLRKLLDVGRMKGLGWESRIGLEEGIKRTYEWYQNKL